ncbi:ABC transporter permease [Dyella lutea]|uniref:ABC transporter permease n=1 Tax=Dyella lutea TaxID=2950441 RepID=A0ABT1FC78_9GAMM|nr:ABC transporter permease [Dyella lutea]MCP1373877.1 ABC transporter permease [Dyella lutea]
MSPLLAELWRAWRASLRRPGFLLLASGVLALGVGASAAVFALLDATLLRPLPFPQASRIAEVGRIFGGEVGTISPHEYQFLDGMHGVRALGLIRPGSVANIAGAGAPRQVPVTYIDRGVLAALDIRPVLGRNFSESEDRPNGPAVVMLSYGLWQRDYGAAAGVVGQAMQVEGRPATIVGVLPQAFDSLPDPGGIVLPLALPPASRDYNHNGHLAIARLAAGVSLASVGAQADARERAMYRDMAMGGNWKQPWFGATSLQAALHRGERPVMMLFVASAVLILLIALVNLINLMLLRTLSRSHDVAVRSALGAPLLRLLLPAAAEGLLVGVVGTALGMLLAWSGLRLLLPFIPSQWLHGGRIDMGAPLWIMAFAVGLLGALLAAALGLWRSRGATGVDELREGGRSGMGARSGRLGRVLVVVQVALAVALLCSAGAIAHGVLAASRVQLGFASDQLLTFELVPVKAHYPDVGAVQTLAQRVARRLRAIPGVTGAAVTTNLPASDGLYGQFNNGMKTPEGKQFEAQLHGVGTGFFQVFSIALKQGRVFGRDDTAGSEPVAVVSRDLADRYYDGNAIGRTVMVEVSHGPDLPVRIVGVVANTYQRGPLQPRQPMVYLPLAQMPRNTMDIFLGLEPLRFVLRVHGRPADWRASVEQAVAEVAPGQPIAHLESMRSIVRQTTADARLGMLMVGLFDALSLLLAVAGMYAVIAVAVAAREREFGVRTALGASPSRMTRLVLRGGLGQVVVGLVIGVGLALGASRLLASLSMAVAMSSIGRIGVFDPVATLGVCVVLALSGLLACLLPALRAGRVQPMSVLRGD